MRPSARTRIATAAVGTLLALLLAWWFLQPPFPFYSGLWQKADPASVNLVTRLQMAKYLVHSGNLLGKRRGELEGMLGPAYEPPTRVEVARGLAKAFGNARPEGPWDNAIAFSLRCHQTYYLPVCSELAVRLDASNRVVDAKIFE